MQLLTASKLSTVAMLVMAAVLHFSVSAVPMEQAGVEVAPVVEASLDDSVFQIQGLGQPSQQSIEKLSKLMLSVGTDVSTSPQSLQTNNDDLLNSLPPEATAQILGNMSAQDQFNLVRTSKASYKFLPDAQQRYLKELNAQLAEEWSVTLNEHPPYSDDEENEYYLLVSRRWEQIIKKVYNKKSVKSCPVELLPFSKLAEADADLTEQQLLDLSYTPNEAWKTALHQNICRLIVNDAYQWLLSVMTLPNKSMIVSTLSMMYQLRQLSSDPTLKAKLDLLLPFFIRLTETNFNELSCDGDEDASVYFIMASFPSLIPSLDLETIPVLPSLLLIMATKYLQEHKEARLEGYGQEFLEGLSIGNLDELSAKIGPHILHFYDLEYYSTDATKSLFLFKSGASQTVRTLIDNQFDLPSTMLELVENKVSISDPHHLMKYIHPVDALVNVLDVNQFEAFYGSTFATMKHPIVIAMAGTSRISSEYMEHVFADVFGPDGSPMDRVDAQVDGEALSVEHLVQLVQTCAIVCTKTNWDAFSGLFISKMQATPQLPGSQDPANLTQSIASALAAATQVLVQRYQSKVSDLDAKQQQALSSDVDAVIGKLQRLAQTMDTTMPSESFASIASSGPRVPDQSANHQAADASTERL